MCAHRDRWTWIEKIRELVWIVKGLRVYRIQQQWETKARSFSARNTWKLRRRL